MTSTVGDLPHGPRSTPDPAFVPPPPATPSSDGNDGAGSRPAGAFGPDVSPPSRNGDGSPALQSPLATQARDDADGRFDPGRANDPRAGATSTARTDGDAAIAAEEAERSVLGMRRTDRLVLAGLVAVGLALSVVHWMRLTRWGLEPVEIERLEPRPQDWRIDVNTAEWIDLVQLEGVGEVLAQRILDDRAERGPFQSVDDLRRVKGIGEKTLEKLRPWLVVVPPDETSPETGPTGPPEARR